jgi:hypothetical protein
MKPQQLALYKIRDRAQRIDTLHGFKIRVNGQDYSINTGCYDNTPIVFADFDVNQLRLNTINLFHYQNWTQPAHEIRVYFKSVEALKVWIRRHCKKWYTRRAIIHAPYLAALQNGDVTGLTEEEAQALRQWENAQVKPFSVELIAEPHDLLTCEINDMLTDTPALITIHWRK